MAARHVPLGTVKVTAAVAWIAAAALLLGGCSNAAPRPESSGPPSSPITTPLQTTTLMPAPALTPTPSPAATTAPTPLDAEAALRRATELRADWGFESDEDWVRAVHADPEADMSALGILMLPDELEQLEEMFRQEPSSRLIAYGELHREQFAGVFVDPPGGQTYVLLFTGDLERHRANLAALQGGVPFEVRHAPHTEDALMALLRHVSDELRSMAGIQFMSASLDTIDNVVEVELKTNDPTFEAALEAKYAGMLNVVSFPIPGPWQNTAAGEGWRLLAAGESNQVEPYTVRAALTEADWIDLWTYLDPVNPRPEVDLSMEIVVSFQEGIGSTCREVRLDDVVIDVGRSLIFSTTSDPLGPRVCTADLAGAAFWVIALERATLPQNPFTVRLHEDLICRGDGCGFDEEIEIDLE